MKRTLAWVLLFVMLLGMFAGCKKQEAETPTTAPTVEVVTASDAMEYVKAIYPNTEEALKTPFDFERMGVVRISDIPFTVVWSTDLSEDLIKIVPSEDGTVVTIDVNEQCEADTPYVLTATITDEQGNVATHSWNCVLPKAVDMASIVKQAYALKKGESLPYECTLIGKIVSFYRIWDPDYQNVSVNIVVEGAEDMPILCYNMKGTGADSLLVGNIITVTGTLKNYNGTIEFDSGCILEAVEKGDAVEAPTDVGEILKAAYKLKKGKSLPYVVTLTGKVTTIDSPYDPGYKNISVVIEMEGYSKYPILCYRLKGKDVENIAVGDTITVTGVIKNYNGTIEFDAGCKMTNRVSGGGVAQKPSSDQNKILRDAKKLKEGEKLAYIATLTGEVVSVDDAYSSQYKNVTVTMLVAGTKIQCYRMKGDDASKVRVTDKITVTGQIMNYYGKLEFGSGCTLDKWVKGSRIVKIDMGPLKENTAYKMEMSLPTLGKNVYFDGGISDSHYLYTGTYEQGVDVFMEKTEKKGVRFFFMDGETKTYIEIKTVKVANKETGKLEDKVRPQLATTPSVYWTYSEDAGVYTVDINGTKYYLGTYLNNGSVFETASASSIYYITDTNAKNKGKTQFYFEFVTKASDAPEVPVEPEKPTISGLPAYNAELKTGDQVVIYAPAYSKALSTEKVSHYNKGVDLTVKNKALSGYGKTETFTVTANADGTYSFTNGGKKLAMADQYSSMNLGEKHDKWQLISLGNGLYNIKNVGRGNFMEWYAEKDNWSSYATSSAATNKLCQLSFYVIGKGVLTQPSELPETPDVPAVDLPEQDGAVVSIADAIAAGLAMEHDTYTEKKYKVTGEITEVYNTTYGNMKIKDAAGNILTIYGTYDATGEIRYDALTVKPVVGDTVTIYGVIGQYRDTPQIKNGWIVAHTPGAGTPEQPEEPDTPDTPDVPAEPALNYVDAPVAGTAYKFVLNQVGLGKHLGFTGVMDGFYYATSESIDEMVDVYLEAVTGGYNLYFMNGNVKTYLNVVPRENDATKINVVLQTAAENATPSVYTLNTEFKYLKTTAPNGDWYFGTYGTYTTINASNTSYIEDTSKIGVSQFTVWFATVGEDETPETPDEVQTLTLTEANALAAQQDHNTYTEKEYKVTGKITEISNDQYGNAIITDESGVTFGIYGMYKDGTRYDAMEVKPQVGDTITIQGGVGRYYENYQIKNGELVEHIPAGTTPEQPENPEDPAVATIAEALAATTGDFTVKGVITMIDSKNVYVQDATGAICAYMAQTPEGIALGDTIIVTGSRLDYNGLPELSSATFEKSSGLTLTAKNATLAQLTTADICGYVKLTDLEVTSVTVGSSGKPDIMLKDAAGNTIKFYKAVVEGTVNVGDTLDVTGAIGVYNTDLQLRNTLATEIVINPASSETPETPEEVQTLTIADAYAMGREMDHNTYTEVKYKVTGIIQSVDSAEYGNLTLTDGNGNYLTIYGSFDATGEVSYKDMTAKPDEGDTVTIYGAVGQYSNNPQIKDGWILSFTPGELPEVDVPAGVSHTLSFADTANRLSQTTEQQVWSQNGVTVTNDKAASTSNIIDSSNPVRFYKNSSVTIEATGMKTIVVTCNNASYASALVSSITATSGVTVTSTGKVVTIELATAANSFVIGALSGGQVRVDEITVYTAS